MSTATEERIAIGDLIEQLCERLGFDENMVVEILFKPGKVAVTRLVPNERGRPWMNENGDAVVETIEVEVTT